MSEQSSAVGRQSSVTPRPSSAMGLYVHIPFCVQKCFYCDFNSSTVNHLNKKEYINSLEREIESSRWSGTPVKTLFFGGGTPSELTVTQLDRMLAALRRQFDFDACTELTIECNPESVNARYFKQLLDLGFNRISLGVQSFDDHYLEHLGRIHNAARALAAIEEARGAGVENLSLDLIFGLHGQSLGEWLADLQRALEASPEHLSLYGLMIEPGTEFGRRHKAGQLPILDNDLAADMFEASRERTAAAGYRQYEISNFARPGFECAHNLVYWHNEPYLGLGVSAASYIGRRRWSNPANWDSYCSAAGNKTLPECSLEQLDGLAAAGEAAMLGLRTAEGICMDRLSTLYGVNFQRHFASKIAFLIEQGLIKRREQGLTLTPRGQLLASEVGMRFLV